MGPDESALPTADAALQGSPRELELLLCTRLLLPPEPGGAGQLLPQQNCSRKPERHPGQLACQAGAAGIPPRRERLLCAEIGVHCHRQSWSCLQAPRHNQTTEGEGFEGCLNSRGDGLCQQKPELVLKELLAGGALCTPGLFPGKGSTA